jgi:hypothetical protein
VSAFSEGKPMLTTNQIEELNDSIQHMDREEIVDRLQHFVCRFPIDFTPEFLAKEPLSRLRHILFGLCLHNQKPLMADVAA